MRDDCVRVRRAECFGYYNSKRIKVAVGLRVHRGYVVRLNDGDDDSSVFLQDDVPQRGWAMTVTVRFSVSSCSCNLLVP